MYRVYFRVTCSGFERVGMVVVEGKLAVWYFCLVVVVGGNQSSK